MSSECFVLIRNWQLVVVALCVGSGGTKNQCSVSLRLCCVGLSDSDSEKHLNGAAATQDWLIIVS